MLLLCCEVSGVLEADDGNPDFICMFLEARFNNSTARGKANCFLRAKSYMPIPFELPERLKKGDV